ncbi:DUF1015 domain-containing protein [Candidatus Poribacteria bacterium]|nr:DUF1015 domain-containing protein [Candidatus Poribacteria bacterium]
MAEVWPFAGTRFASLEQGINLAKVICPPYDDIPVTLQKELHERDPQNVVRLVLGHSAASDDDSNNRYMRSAECYRDWKARGILADEQRKCFYVYEQEFQLPGQETPTRRIGFFALVKLQDFRSGKIRAHEMTFDSLKQDRLRLLRTMAVNESPIHIVYHDEPGEVNSVLEEMLKKKTEPAEDFTCADGIHHRLWLMHRKEPILRIHEALKPKRLYIADGNHRYETALKYRDEMREMTGRRDGRQPYDFVLMFLQRAEDDALFTQPVHRVLARELSLDTEIEEVLEDLEDQFTLSEFKLNMKDPEKAEQAVIEKIRPNKQAKTRYVMALPSGRAWVVTLKKGADLNGLIDDETMSETLKAMDVTILHRFIIARGWIGNPEVELGEDDIYYRTSVQECLKLLQQRKGCVAFFMNPTSKEEILQVAEFGELLPHHPAEIHPKIPCGLVLRDHNVGFG